jgi:hypothetical protein
MKDPISLLSAEWLQKTFEMEVVVVIRHPAAFVGSLKKGNASFPFEHLLAQEQLMKDHLFEYEETIRKYASDPPDIIDQGILLWNLFNEMILKYRTTHSNWLFYRHEDLSREPVIKFREIYEKLGLNYSPTIKKKITKHSSANSNEQTQLKRDSESNIWSWKRRLTREEVLRIYEGTYQISQKLLFRY